MSRDPLERLLSLEEPSAGPALPLGPEASERLVASALAEAFPGSGPASPADASADPFARRVTRATGAGGVAALVGAGIVVVATGLAFLVRPARAPVSVEPRAERATAAEAKVEHAAADNAARSVKEAPAIAAPGPEKRPGLRPEARLSEQELLGAANAARRARRWREADALYSKVVEHFPSSPVAFVAALASAELRLELLGDARGARERFRFATRGGEAHALDAYEGLAAACRALADAACEAEARAEIVARRDGRGRERPAP